MDTARLFSNQLQVNSRPCFSNLILSANQLAAIVSGESRRYGGDIHLMTQIVTELQQAEALPYGQTIGQANKAIGISEQT